MNRREFLKGLAAFAAMAPMQSLLAKAGLDGDKIADQPQGDQVTRRAFRGTGLTLPLLGFGTMRLPLQKDGKIDMQHTARMFDRALKAGCNYFDTAYMYVGGKSESCVGTLLSSYSRDSYYLTSKLPINSLRKPEDMERIFNEQLERTRGGYFDFYLAHALNGKNWKTMQEFKTWDFLEKKKAEGKIRHIGFSFHDSPEVLKTIAEAHPWEFGQLQLNYLDWTFYRSKEQYELLTRMNMPVIVMEPLRGGTLANLNAAANDILHKAAPEASTASWAFRWVASLPNVVCVLSGMSSMDHLTDNLKTFSPLKPLSKEEEAVLKEAKTAYGKSLAVPCTTCQYCQPCPVGVEIPRIFGLYNQYKLTGNAWNFRSGYNSLPEDGRANACIGCGRCVKQCPQHIDIPQMLKKIAAEI